MAFHHKLTAYRRHARFLRQSSTNGVPVCEVCLYLMSCHVTGRLFFPDGSRIPTTSSVLSPQLLTPPSFPPLRINDSGVGRSARPLIIVASDSSSEFVNKKWYNGSRRLRYSRRLQLLHPSMGCSEQSTYLRRKKPGSFQIHHFPFIPMKMRRRSSEKYVHVHRL